MGRRGPTKKAKHLKVLAGTDRPDRDGDTPDVVESALSPEPPEHLPDLAAEFWRRTVPQLAARGIGTVAQAPLLEAASLLYHRARMADDVIQAQGASFICERTGNPKRHPMAIESSQCWKDLRSALREIGVTDVKAKPKGPANPFDELESA